MAKLQAQMNQLMEKAQQEKEKGDRKGNGGKKRREKEERAALDAKIATLVDQLALSNAELERVNALFDMDRRVLHTPGRLVPVAHLIEHQCLRPEHAKQITQAFQILQASQTRAHSQLAAVPKKPDSLNSEKLLSMWLLGGNWQEDEPNAASEGAAAAADQNPSSGTKKENGEEDEDEDDDEIQFELGQRLVQFFSSMNIFKNSTCTVQYY